MPDLTLVVSGVAPVVDSLSPMLKFEVRVSAGAPTQTVQALILHAQIQFQPAQRAYSPSEKAKLTEIFGAPPGWGRTLRNRLWAHASTTASAFTGGTEVGLLVPCTYDLNQAATKYFCALEGDEVSLVFLFSGSVFYSTPDGRLQVQPISWDQECEYRMPLRVWQAALDTHFPNSAWISLRKDVFGRLMDHKRALGAVSWEEAFEALLQQAQGSGESGPSVARSELPNPPVPSHGPPPQVAA